ncbi:MAG: P-loop NTPase [Clostridia bacterium]|nr:P-loop NTPase [Clostridia bacterium]
MLHNKRLTLLCGHYGTGKTNVAVNLALALKARGEAVTVADLDIVNPYFRTMDSADAFEHAGIRLICSRFANSNVDIPSLPPDLYAITDDRETRMVLDIGGDDSGATVLGRLAPAILAEDSFEMWMVVNQYRPLTRDVPSTLEVMGEIAAAAGLPFTGVVNNSNLGAETTADHVLATVEYAEAVAKAAGVPLVMTTVDRRLAAELEGKVPNLFPLTLQDNKPF